MLNKKQVYSGDWYLQVSPEGNCWALVKVSALLRHLYIDISSKYHKVQVLERFELSAREQTGLRPAAEHESSSLPNSNHEAEHLTSNYKPLPVCSGDLVCFQMRPVCSHG